MLTDPSKVNTFFDIQCDWEESLRRKNGNCWITCKLPSSEKSIHKKLTNIGENEYKIQAESPFKFMSHKRFKDQQSIVIRLEHEDGKDVECNFVSPFESKSDIFDGNSFEMDISEGGLGVAAYQNNKMIIWETETGAQRRILDGHTDSSDIYTCKFFPSGLVVLSGGSDMLLKITSAETGDCPVTLRGHTSSIQDTAFVDRGRNIISISKDGTARLWDVGQKSCLAVLNTTDAIFNSCQIVTNPELCALNSNISEREVGTEGKLLVIAQENSKFQGVCIASRTQVFYGNLPSAGNKVIASGLNKFTIGCQGGEVVTFDIRKTNELLEIQENVNKSPVLDLILHPRSNNGNQGIWIARRNGTLSLKNNNKYHLLTGSDSDPIYKIKHDGTYIYTSCRDKVIRKYSIDALS